MACSNPPEPPVFSGKKTHVNKSGYILFQRHAAGADDAAVRRTVWQSCSRGEYFVCKLYCTRCTPTVYRAVLLHDGDHDEPGCYERHGGAVLHAACHENLHIKRTCTGGVRALPLHIGNRHTCGYACGI